MSKISIQIASDLHCEYQRDHGESLFASIKPVGDVLVLAGDIIPTRWEEDLRRIVADVADRWEHVIYVSGNHEMYGGHFKRSLDRLYEVCGEYSNVHFLDNTAVTIKNTRFFGGTGWFPNPIGNPIAMSAREQLNDFYQIADLERYCYDSHRQFEKGALTGNPDVIVSHHLPDQRCVHAKYAGNALNHFFVSDFDVEAIDAKLWIHGHSHTANDLMIGSTRVISNPFGYARLEPDSMNAFREDLVVEVSL